MNAKKWRRRKRINSCNACTLYVVLYTHTYVWVENHQKLVVCLRASLPSVTVPSFQLGEQQPYIHSYTLQNTHLFFTHTFLCCSLPFSLFRHPLRSFVHSHTVTLYHIYMFFSVLLVSHPFGLSMAFNSSERSCRRTFHMEEKSHHILHLRLLLHQFQIP